MDRTLSEGASIAPHLDVKPTAASPQPARRNAERWAALAALGAVWAIAINHLRVEWTINEQYSYGWLVPLLAGYLFALRWRTRPEAQPPRFPRAFAAFLAVIAILWLPIHLLQVSSPDWRLIGWALTGLALIFTTGGIYLLGGVPWLIHFSFPLAFMLVAVPWPVPVEQAVIQTLMRWVAAASVEALRWCGFPAVQQGNLIILGSNIRVGFEEACSGVRSMQTMIMTALFLGEIWYRGWWRRLTLVIFGVLIAFLFNIARAFTLAWMAGSSRAAVPEVLHDRIGLLFLALTIASFTGVAYWLRKPPVDSVSLSRSGDADLGRRIPVLYSGALLVWLCLVWIGAEVWYRSGEGDQARTQLVINWPEEEQGFREIPIPGRTGVILRQDEGRSATWRGADGDQWAMVYLRWDAGSAAVQLARAHTPDICLPAAGGKLEADRGRLQFQAGGVELPAHAFLFSAGGRPMHVFYLRVGDDAGTHRLPADIEELTIANRIRGAMARRRNRGQQVVEVAVTSYRTAAEVSAAFQAFAGEAFRIAPRLTE